MPESKRWTVIEIAKAAAEVLAKSGIEQGRLDADLLLAEVLGVKRLDLYTRWDMPVDDLQRSRYRELIRRRSRREPLAYVLGRRDFLDWSFEVNPAVLVPRPDTEHLVECAGHLLKGRDEARILDLGTGSGCILISLLLRHPEASGLGVDLSEEALAVARRNGERLGAAARAEFRRSDLFDAVDADARFDLVLSNPPYIRRDEEAGLAPEIRLHEPALALYDPVGEGLGMHERILSAGMPRLRDGGAFVLELPGWGGAVLAERALALAPGMDWTVVKDYGGEERVFVASQGPLPPEIPRYRPTRRPS